MPLRIIIVGAGIAGLATAIGFVRHGHHVTIVERKPSLAEESGSGIILGPNAVRVLEAWGLKADFETVAHVSARTRLRRFQTGQVVKEMSKPKDSLMNWYVRRVDAWKILYEYAVKSGVTISFGMPVMGLDEQQSAVLFENGSSMKGDLIVGADGIHSRIRHALFPQATPQAQQECTFQVLLPQSTMEQNPLTKQLYNDPSLQIWLAPGRHGIAQAVPKRHEYDIQLTDHVYGFEPDGSVGTWNERITDMSWLRDRFKDFVPAIRIILAEASSCWKWRLAESATLSSWTSENGKVALLGDSCHAMVPFAGQGASQCIEDAAVLSELFSQTSSTEDIRRLTKTYEELRRPRVESVREYARRNGEGFTLSDGAEQTRRDEILQSGARTLAKKGGKVPFGDTKFSRWLDEYDAIKDAQNALKKLDGANSGNTVGRHSSGGGARL